MGLWARPHRQPGRPPAARQRTTPNQPQRNKHHPQVLTIAHLRQVPIDVLKIDRSFIGSMSSSEQQRALVDGIVRLAHTLGLQVVAEGIERSIDRDALSDIGCPLGQGYLFSGPLSYRDAVRWLLSQHVAA